MPLHDNHTYVLRNELTHTVLDLTGNPERRLFGTPTLSPLPASSTMLTQSIISYGLEMARTR
jgi:hypothetical protein